MLSKVRRPNWKLRSVLRFSQIIFIVLIFSQLFRYICELMSHRKPKFDYPLDEDFYLIADKMSKINAIFAPPQFVPQPINSANFSIMLSDDTLCRTGPESNRKAVTHPELLLLVKTKPTSFVQREIIRQTWGNPRCATVLGNTSRTVFVLGSVLHNNLIQTKLFEEHAKHKDLLQFDFVDDYRNNTYKVMSALQYVAVYCSRTKFVVLLDDDFLVHTDNLLKHLAQVLPAQYPIYTAGHVYHTSLPYRLPWSKWYVSHDEYPYPFYPRFASGGTIIMSMPVARLVAIGLQFVRFFRIDDVLVGIVLQKYGISPMHLNRIYLLDRAPTDKWLSMISSHGFGKPHLLQDGWNHLKSANVCSVD